MCWLFLQQPPTPHKRLFTCPCRQVQVSLHDILCTAQDDLDLMACLHHSPVSRKAPAYNPVTRRIIDTVKPAGSNRGQET